MELAFKFFCRKEIRKRSKADASLIHAEGWKRFWDRMGGDVPDFRGKIVCDYGCGKGYDSQIILSNGAEHVYGLDIVPRLLDEAKCNHLLAGYNNVTYILNDAPFSLPETIGKDCVDIIVVRPISSDV